MWRRMWRLSEERGTDMFANGTKDISTPNISKLGIGWRPELAVAIERRKDLEFVEIVAENWSVKELPIEELSSFLMAFHFRLVAPVCLI
jgi:hypothetical protein